MPDQERFDFLGYSFGPHYPYRWNGQWYVGASPSKKSMQRLKAKVRELLVPGNNDPWQDVRDTLNRTLRGWSNYFCHGTRRPAFRAVDHYVYERVRDFLARHQSGRARYASVLLRGCLRRSLACCVSNACPDLSRRVPCGEASRRAGYRKPVRPVRERGGNGALATGQLPRPSSTTTAPPKFRSLCDRCWVHDA